MRTRAERRHHSKRVKNKFHKMIRESWGYFDSEWAHRYSLKNYNNRKPCSCWMCRSERKYGKGKERFTIQERKVIEAGMEKG